MIVAATSSLISLTTADTLNLFLSGFTVHTTETVIEELEDNTTIRTAKQPTLFPNTKITSPSTK